MNKKKQFKGKEEKKTETPKSGTQLVPLSD